MDQQVILHDDRSRSRIQVDRSRSPDMVERQSREQTFTEHQAQMERIVKAMDKVESNYPSVLFSKADISIDEYHAFKYQAEAAVDNYRNPNPKRGITQPGALRNLEFATKKLSEIQEKWSDYVRREIFSEEKKQFDKMKPLISRKDEYRDLDDISFITKLVQDGNKAVYTFENPTEIVTRHYDDEDAVFAMPNPDQIRDVQSEALKSLQEVNKTLSTLKESIGEMTPLMNRSGRPTPYVLSRPTSDGRSSDPEASSDCIII